MRIERVPERVGARRDVRHERPTIAADHDRPGADNERVVQVVGDLSIQPNQTEEDAPDGF